MKQRLVTYKDKIIEYWQSKSAKQKGSRLFLVLLFLVIVIGGSVLATSTSMVPLYNNLSIQEVGQIKAELDARGVKYQVEGAGTAIHVPSEQADTLLVDLAAQGIPNNGSIDYSFFSENSSWGMTDNEFDVMKLDAMQTELANLISGISGIESANVMINLPKEQVFVSDQQQEASASIVLETTPGYQFESGQIDALYHLVSKTVPNLSNDNIVIMDGNFNYYDQNNQKNVASGDIYTTQQNIKQDIERDIQRRVQQMLGTMIGVNKVVSSVTADIDFSQVNRIEEIVEPVVEDETGLPVSVETITETYTGDGAAAAVPGDGEEDIANYSAGENGSGVYEMVQESINYEVSRIQREIVESPYKIRDIGIQIAVDNTKETVDSNGDPELLTAQEQADVEASIASILDSIITTSIDAEYETINPGERTSIVFQEFSDRPTAGSGQPVITGIPTWIYIAGGVLILLVIGLVILLVTKRNTKEVDTYSEELQTQQETFDIPDIEEAADSESSIRRKQLEKMAKDKPEEFAKILRSWIAED